MHIEVSTAGNNPDGYGKERFDYADEVLRGVVEDQNLFVAIYAAPQDLSDSDFDADPLKYARMANPAMGRWGVRLPRFAFLPLWAKAYNSWSPCKGIVANCWRPET